MTFHLDFELELSTPWMYAHLETILCKFGGDLAFV